MGAVTARTRTLAAAALAQAQAEAGARPRALGTAVRAWLFRLALHAGALALAAAAFAAHEHLELQGASTASTASLVAAAVLGFAPVRALVGELFALEGKLLHLVHGVGGLGLLGLALGGAVSGRPLLDRAALAPLALMGAPQALLHADHPRTAEQAAALRRFVASLPETRQLARAELRSPADARRAVAALGDLIGKAQALGETELASDPGFRGAMARLGLSLGLDTVDDGLTRLGQSPAAARSLPELRRRLAAARSTVAR